MFSIIRYITLSFLLINFLLFLFRFFKENKAFKIYTIYLGLFVFIEVISIVVIKFGYQNLIFSHLYFSGQFILLSLFYLELIKVPFQRKIIQSNLLIIPAVLLINFSINPDDIHQFSLLEIILTAMSLIAYSTFHFYNLLSSKREFYYINAGILIYLFGSIVVFLPRNLHTIYGRDFSDVLVMLNILLYFVYHIFICIEWYTIKSNYINEKNK